MKTEEQEFFYQVTTRICSSLHLDEAIESTMEYLEEVMPVTEMAITYYDYKKDKHRLIARGTANKAKIENVVYQLPASALVQILQKDHSKIEIIDPRKDPVIASMFKTEKMGDKSCMIVPLLIKEELLGMAIFFTHTENMFSKKDGELFKIVQRPIGMVVANCLEHLELEKIQRKTQAENIRLKKKFIVPPKIIGKDGGLKDVFRMIEMVAPLNSPILLLGESGTGKDIIAKEIHSRSSRNGNPFIKINCDAISKEMADSVLFGHEKGAFPGAIKQHIGKYEKANHGTLMIDEIGDLPLDIQCKLLRVIEENEFERMGGTQKTESEVRLICTSNQNIQRLVQERKFREDLLYRINVFPVMIPPLRQRKEDIPDLVEYFMKCRMEEMGIYVTPEISEEDMKLLTDYDWPGNVRELQNIVERALIFRKGNQLSFKDIMDPLSVRIDSLALDDTMSIVIKEALDKANGKISGAGGAAEILNINPSTLRSRMKKLGIESCKS